MTDEELDLKDFEDIKEISKKVKKHWNFYHFIILVLIIMLIAVVMIHNLNIDQCNVHYQQIIENMSIIRPEFRFN